jgi:hypothetical protein
MKITSTKYCRKSSKVLSPPHERESNVSNRIFLFLVDQDIVNQIVNGNKKIYVQHVTTCGITSERYVGNNVDSRITYINMTKYEI